MLLLIKNCFGVKADIDKFLKGKMEEMETTDKVNYGNDPLGDNQNCDYQEMVEKANKIVAGFTASTGVTGAIPIPFADLPLLVAQQVAMMIAINKVFEIDVERDVLVSLVNGAIGVGGASVIGKTVVSNILKLIPGAGTAAGGAISAGTAGVITSALGKAYIKICKEIKMGKWNTSELRKKTDILKKAFKEQIKQSRK